MNHVNLIGKARSEAQFIQIFFFLLYCCYSIIYPFLSNYKRITIDNKCLITENDFDADKTLHRRFERNKS